MTFDLPRIMESKRAWRRSLAHRPVAEKLALLDEMRDRACAVRAAATRHDLSRLFRTGRISLVIGLAFLAVAIVVGEALAGRIRSESYGWLVKESLIIGGWVALWRPLEIFLYDWWPIRDEARLYERLSRAAVRLESTDAATAPAPALGVQ